MYFTRLAESLNVRGKEHCKYERDIENAAYSEVIENEIMKS
jgi:hypothetical protein